MHPPRTCTASSHRTKHQPHDELTENEDGHLLIDRRLRTQQSRRDGPPTLLVIHSHPSKASATPDCVHCHLFPLASSPRLRRRRLQKDIITFIPLLSSTIGARIGAVTQDCTRQHKQPINTNQRIQRRWH